MPLEKTQPHTIQGKKRKLRPAKTKQKNTTKNKQFVHAMCIDTWFSRSGNEEWLPMCSNKLSRWVNLQAFHARLCGWGYFHKMHLGSVFFIVRFVRCASCLTHVVYSHMTSYEDKMSNRIFKNGRSMIGNFYPSIYFIWVEIWVGGLEKLIEGCFRQVHWTSSGNGIDIKTADTRAESVSQRSLTSDYSWYKYTLITSSHKYSNNTDAYAKTKSTKKNVPKRNWSRKQKPEGNISQKKNPKGNWSRKQKSRRKNEFENRTPEGKMISKTVILKEIENYVKTPTRDVLTSFPIVLLLLPPPPPTHPPMQFSQNTPSKEK